MNSIMVVYVDQNHKIGGVCSPFFFRGSLLTSLDIGSISSLEVACPWLTAYPIFESIVCWDHEMSPWTQADRDSDFPTVIPEIDLTVICLSTSLRILIWKSLSMRLHVRTCVLIGELSIMHGFSPECRPDGTNSINAPHSISQFYLGHYSMCVIWLFNHVISGFYILLSEEQNLC